MVRTLGADAVLVSSIPGASPAINGSSAIKIEAMDDVLAMLEAPWRANLTCSPRSRHHGADCVHGIERDARVCGPDAAA
jgi:hypothetical protein